MQVFDLDAVQTQRSRALTEEGSIRKSKAFLYLDDTDRTIVELVEKGMPHRLIGQAVGVSAGTVSRRLALVRTRLGSPLARCALDPICPLTKDARLVALMYVVGGLNLRQIARKQHLSLAAVSEHLSYGRGLARGTTSRHAV